MNYRIAMWAIAGFVVAGFWALYFFPTTAVPATSLHEMVLILARITCPVVLAGSYLHLGLHFYWVLLANAATYALLGLIAETLRHPLNHAK